MLDVDHSLYADDLKLFREIADSSDEETLQLNLDRIAHWGSLNSLLLNPSKCQVITFTRCRPASPASTYVLGATQLARVSEVKDLGVYLDPKLDFRRHIDRVVARCRSTLGLVKRFAKDFADLDVARTLYCSLVRPIAEYASPVWSPFYESHIARLESVQKQFVLFALGRQRLPNSFALPPYADRLAYLKLDSLRDRRGMACTGFIFDLLMGRITCKQLRDRVVINDNRQGRWSKYLREEYHRTEYGRQEPLNRCVILFNSVATIFKSGLSRNAFRRAVLDHFRTLGHPT